MRKSLVEPLRQPPCAFAQQRQHTWGEHQPHESHINDDRYGQPESDHLDFGFRRERESQEDRRHDDTGRCDQRSRSPNTFDDGIPSTQAVLLHLANRRNEEHVVVHAQSEENREHQHGHEGDDRLLIDAEQRCAPRCLEREGDDAVGRKYRQHVHDRRNHGKPDRTESEEQQHQRQTDDGCNEDAQRRAHLACKIVVCRRLPTDVSNGSGSIQRTRNHVASQSLDKFTRFGRLRCGIRDDGDDSRVFGVVESGWRNVGNAIRPI